MQLKENLGLLEKLVKGSKTGHPDWDRTIRFLVVSALLLY